MCHVAVTQWRVCPNWPPSTVARWLIFTVKTTACSLLYILAALKWPDEGRVAWTFPDGRETSWDASQDKAHYHELSQLHRQYFSVAWV